MMKVSNSPAFLAVLLTGLMCPAFLDSLGQDSTPIKVSLRSTGAPQFPTGYWLSDSDPHFRHSMDKVFWVNSENVAMTFFKEFCCQSGSGRGVVNGAAVFDASGKKVATHQWTSTPGAHFFAEGGAGFFWLQYDDHIDLLKPDFTVAGQIPLPKTTSPALQATLHTFLIPSKSGKWIALDEAGKLTIYAAGESSPTASFTIPVETWVADFTNHAVLLKSKARESCSLGVWPIDGTRGTGWYVQDPASNPHSECLRGLGLISDDAALVEGNSVPLGSDVELKSEIVHRGGSAEPIPTPGEVLGIAASDRIAFQTFHPSGLAKFLDTDFGGHKEFTVYDTSKKTVIFHKTMGGQAGAAIALDGRHFAIVEGNSLLIYSFP